MIVDGGNFDWEAHAERFPLLNQPDPSYHGAVWVEAVKPMGPVAYIIKARVTLLRDLGAAISPFNAFLFIQGLETLPLRIREHMRQRDGGRAISDEPPDGDQGRSTRGLRGRRGAPARRCLPEGRLWRAGRLRAEGRQATPGARFIDALKMFYHVANIGDARSLAIHPASTTHSQLSPEEQLETGVTDGYVRLSVGIEHIDDILADLEQALERAAGLRDAAE